MVLPKDGIAWKLDCKVRWQPGLTQPDHQGKCVPEVRLKLGCLPGERPDIPEEKESGPQSGEDYRHRSARLVQLVDISEKGEDFGENLLSA
ncbi:hypothetical protein E2C01_092475 [Portunus trituberculatus]|uniref:Uncharacterized protein n=1 Tax=Portunus trituberculatus TaxID=210409 RepID=A0A5B7JS54_PORTR|nr:hypothetical protein [Portunus trituberculatus]